MYDLDPCFYGRASGRFLPTPHRIYTTTVHCGYWMLDARAPRSTHQIANITGVFQRNGRHLSVNADLCYEPRREGC